ncbi:MAG: hypothetical protein AABY16_04115 [Nanoarchaeota archaeon]
MKISKILIEDKIKEKVLYKHNIGAAEINEAILVNPYIIKTKDKRYLAIGFCKKVITIIFEMVKDTAFIITAYPSSDSQRKLYKLKRG